MVIEDVTVAPPKAHEVRIKVLYSGVCHTDAYTLSGVDPEGAFPVILGHEGAGIVESVGEGVTNVKPGDHVIVCTLQNVKNVNSVNLEKLICVVKSELLKGVMPDGTPRFTCKGKEILHFMGCSTFSQYTVVADISVVAINEKAEFEKACLLGCGITTGYGAATITANVQEGDNVAVFGGGCVGLSVIQGCKERKANKIILVDINDKKKNGVNNLVPLILSTQLNCQRGLPLSIN